MALVAADSLAPVAPAATVLRTWPLDRADFSLLVKSHRTGPKRGPDHRSSFGSTREQE